MTRLWHKTICFLPVIFIFVSFFLYQTAQASATFGHACSSNSDCISRDCEDGFCDCSNADSCARSFQGSADDWQCVDEGHDPLHRGLEFCVKSSFGDSYPDHSTDEVKYPLEELLPMGAMCYNASNCKSGDCDESNVSGSDTWNRDAISYCDCSDANSCALGYGGEEQDWECLGETEANRDINYCLNINESAARDPFQSPPDGNTGETPANPTLSDAVLDPTAVSAMTQSDLNTLLQKPQPRIKIPGLNFSGASVKEFEVTDDDGTKWLVIPYLGEYLAAIYKYGIVVITILSVIALIDGGLTYIMSNGKTQNQESGIKRIKGAVMGLILAVGSYVILYTINPELTQFRNLKVLYIRGSDDYAMMEELRNGTEPTVSDTGSEPYTGSYSSRFVQCPITLTTPRTSEHPSLAARNREFFDKIGGVISPSAPPSERIMQVADAILSCDLYLGNCGRTVGAIYTLAGITSKAYADRSCLTSATTITKKNGEKVVSGGRGCWSHYGTTVYRSISSTNKGFNSILKKYNSLNAGKTETEAISAVVNEIRRLNISGWPNQWADGLQPGDAIIIYNANGRSQAGSAGTHAAIFLGWDPKEPGVAQTLNGGTYDGHGGATGPVQMFRICLKTDCADTKIFKPLITIFKPG